LATTKAAARRKRKSTKVPEALEAGAKTLGSERPQSSPGPKPSLTADQIAQASIAVADTEGLAAVSMQRIAREVHVTTMALYRYFSGKAELIDLMIDAAGGPVPDLNAVARGWRSGLAEWTRRCSAIYDNHPWFLQATTRPRRIMGPNELGWLNAALHVLRNSGLTAREQHEAFLLLIGHVRSNAEFTAGRSPGPSAESWLPKSAKLSGQFRDCYPALMAVVESGAFSQPSGDGLEFGLTCILNGIESIIRKRRIPRKAYRS
jgi:AcrR family transcriptional regulator